ncbi:hypothetical protein Rsub_09171 [Raphidocelis subcapitata]|uniref:Uncharacterized protein n=1 Tax=Raphidocelis subcapitata TaxID=307507 RepID=A0A2V0PBR6_9CHLO|nr:hypothetical protein Rsub_09171 [Raphidocelis subcapitata]|eukprot:GBF96372.1 hypothetical protein Rsub_09171 [Raphidocelis subcapitata]
MPPIPDATAPAQSDAAAAALPNDLQAHVCSLLPIGDAVLTVSRLNKAMAAAVAPRRANAREVVADVEIWHDELTRCQFLSIPLWALQEAWPQLGERQRTHAAARAALHGDLAAVRWALLRLPQADAAASVCEAAAASGQLEALQCALALGCPWDKQICRAAADWGRLAVLQWARAQQPPCPWDERTCEAAAKRGHLAVLQWAHAQQPPCPWDRRTCEAAAWHGHLAVLQWARAQQPPCPWDEGTCLGAAFGGHLAVLQWARAQQPPRPWDEESCMYAAMGGHLAVLQWARAQDPPCPWDEHTTAWSGEDTIEWLRAQAALEGVAL